MQKVKDFEELHCWKLAMRLYYDMSQITKQYRLDTDDELVCRWLVSGLHISGKIAFAFGAEDHERFLERLPLAKKYSFECAFWTALMQQKKYLKKHEAVVLQQKIKRIVKKLNAIIRYLEKYGEKEKYSRQLFFEQPTVR